LTALKEGQHQNTRNVEFNINILVGAPGLLMLAFSPVGKTKTGFGGFGVSFQTDSFTIIRIMVHRSK